MLNSASCRSRNIELGKDIWNWSRLASMLFTFIKGWLLYKGSQEKGNRKETQEVVQFSQSLD